MFAAQSRQIWRNSIEALKAARMGGVKSLAQPGWVVEQEIIAAKAD